MKLQFLGATRQVTGSCYLLENGGSRVLVDCGLFQERRFLERNWADFPVDPASVDAVLLTHAHLDHCGLLPRFVRNGFKGSIITTEPSVDLAAIVVRDSAKINEEDAEFKAKRHAREGRKSPHPVVPLYTSEDAERVIPLLRGVTYNQPIEIGHGAATVRFHEAGHILGSAMLEVDLHNGASGRKLIFSGDIGRWNKPLIQDPTLFQRADFVVMESTYGDRSHQEDGSIDDRLAEIITRTVEQRGKLLVPTFAIERAQELVYRLAELARAGRIPTLPVFLDSPMAVRVNDVFRQHRGYFDEEATQLVNSGDHPLEFEGLRLVRTVEESKAINEMAGPFMVMAGSGMCTGGRIKHHLANHVEDLTTTVLFVGYQAPDTLGGIIRSGVKEVRIHGQMRRVRAAIEQVHGLSAHADRPELLRWLKSFKAPPAQVFLTHGEETVAVKLANELRQTWNWSVTVPEYRQTVALS